MEGSAAPAVATAASWEPLERQSRAPNVVRVGSARPCVVYYRRVAELLDGLLYPPRPGFVVLEGMGPCMRKAAAVWLRIADAYGTHVAATFATRSVPVARTTRAYDEMLTEVAAETRPSYKSVLAITLTVRGGGKS